MKILISTLLSLPIVLGPIQLVSQAIDLDEGTFVIELDGRVVGTESFKIRSAGSGTDMRIIAQGNTVVNTGNTSETIQSALGAVGPTMLVEAYQTRILPSNIEINLQRRGDRFLALTSSDLHLEEREYRRIANETPTIILDDFFAHHYFLLLPHQFTDSKEFLALFPRIGEQDLAILSLGLVEPISIGSDLIQAQYLQLDIAGVIHRIWTDGRNRILRVEIPQKNYLAYRSPKPGN